jgi:choline kinase
VKILSIKNYSTDFAETCRDDRIVVASVVFFSDFLKHFFNSKKKAVKVFRMRFKHVPEEVRKIKLAQKKHCTCTNNIFSSFFFNNRVGGSYIKT